MSIWNKTREFFGYEGNEAVAYQPSAAAARPAPAKVSSIRGGRRGSDITEIATMQPRGYEDAVSIAERFRDGVPVIVNMGEMSEADCRRLLDFMSGLKEGLEGHISRVTQKVFLLSPYNVNIDAEEENVTSAPAVQDLITPFN